MDILWFPLIILLLLIFIGMLPVWPHARRRGWGYYPSLITLALLVLLLVLFWVGVISVWWPDTAY